MEGAPAEPFSNFKSPPIYAFPVVVAPPEMVRPVVCVPPPIVLLAVARSEEVAVSDPIVAV
jgi:hypothetical protein